ncbi:MAG: chromate transporter [Candidatus Carbobacillus altaicus]|uniref:Chromate transport protein n=1 Tax=Candidatus Carbonibacillus altaicus TaxID=2163959 RepID=A0A2R6Y4B7_9BACL|nr:chromate transporter [Candidatus Carbobacillus altaicus]PTQ57493.1 MAG: Chromate transport protein [Candidatus Carbobacillus altaicus]
MAAEGKNAVDINNDKQVCTGERAPEERRALSQSIKRSYERGRFETVSVLFWTFFKISPVTFGGGLAVIPVLEKELVERRGYITREEIIDLFAAAQTVPGAIAVNVATFLGYRLVGPLGAIMATFGAILPTFSIMLLLSIFYLSVAHHPLVEAAMYGLRPAIVALIAFAGVRVARTALIDRLTVGIAAGTYVLLTFLHFHPVLVIFLGGGFGLLVGWWRRWRQAVRGKLN